MMSVRNSRFFLFALSGVALLALAIWLYTRSVAPPTPFNGKRSYQDVLAQIDFGPRIPESSAHAQTISYIRQELEHAGWQVSIQNTQWQGFPLQNILASRSGTGAPLLFGAHYDSRILADQDRGLAASQPVPGAEDGASGVAVLLELGRSLPATHVPVELVFFDMEDDGGLGDRQWLMGSRAFVASLQAPPRAAIILDMVGDANLDIYMEKSSTADLNTSIWSQAAALGYGRYFIPQPKYDMLDDQTPFLEAGIPAVDIIDFDYPSWHTSADTPDKVSSNSLQVVGDTLWSWIMAQR